MRRKIPGAPVAQIRPVRHRLGHVESGAILALMCIQCMAGAMSAGAASSGLRAWLQLHRPGWMTDRHMTWATRAILGAGLLASTVAFGGAG